MNMSGSKIEGVVVSAGPTRGVISDLRLRRVEDHYLDVVLGYVYQIAIGWST